MRDRVSGWVRRHIVRGRDPRDPAASSNGVKTRAMVAVFGPTLAVWGVGSALPLPSLTTATLAALTAALCVGAVRAGVEDAAAEWDADGAQSGGEHA